MLCKMYKKGARDEFCGAYVREKKKQLKLTIKTNIVVGAVVVAAAIAVATAVVVVVGAGIVECQKKSCVEIDKKICIN